MRFRCITPKTLPLRLSSSAFTTSAQPLSQVMSVLIIRFVRAFSSFSSAGLGAIAGHPFSLRLQPDLESWNVRTSVWWDFNNCNLPEGTTGLEVAQAVTSAIRSSRIEGPITIIGCGDVSHLSTANRKSLSAAGINLRHIRPRKNGKPSVLIAIYSDLLDWARSNPPPAHLFVISSDESFARILHNMRRSNYNILFASKEDVPGFLRSAVTIMWDWHSLVKEGNVTGWHFNQPPIGPWYGHYSVPLQDPFEAIEQSNSVKTDESLASKSNLDPKVRLLPLTRELEKEIDKSKSLGFFNRILKWFKFWER